MKAKKFVSMTLASAMVASMMSTGAMAAPTMADAEASWAASHIERWVDAGVVKGDENGNFNPSKTLTRAELATIFVNLFGLSEKASNTYADLNGSEWYADAILKVTAAGIMQGDGKNCNAQQSVTRQEAMTMFSRAMGVAEEKNPNLSQFSDASSVASWAAGYIAPMVELGIISGVGNNQIAAGNSIDRASTMALLDKAITEYVTTAGEVNVDNTKGFVVVNAKASAMGSVNVYAADEKSVSVSGKTNGLVVAAGTSNVKVEAKGLTAETLKIDSTSPVSIDANSSLTTLSINSAAEVVNQGTVKTIEVNAAADVTNKGTVTNLAVNAVADVTNDGTVSTMTLTKAANVTNNGTVSKMNIDSAAKITNNGTITEANVTANNVIVDGKAPEKTIVSSNVTSLPTDSNGTKLPNIITSGGSTGGSTGGGGGTTTPSVPSNFNVNISVLGQSFNYEGSKTTALSSVLGTLLTNAENNAERIAAFIYTDESKDELTAKYDGYCKKVREASSGLGNADIANIETILTALNPQNLYFGTAEARTQSVKNVISGLRALTTTGSRTETQAKAFLTALNDGYATDEEITLAAKVMANPNMTLEQLYTTNGNKNVSMTIHSNGTGGINADIVISVTGA